MDRLCDPLRTSGELPFGPDVVNHHVGPPLAADSADVQATDIGLGGHVGLEGKTKRRSQDDADGGRYASQRETSQTTESTLGPAP